MTFRSMANCVSSGAALFATLTVVCSGQVRHTARKNSGSHVAAPTNSASHVAAEMSQGKLNPAESKPGDTLEVTLKEDVRSNGEVILKKGTNITGVVRNVRRAKGKGEWKSEAQSMIDIEWRVPAPQGHGIQSVSFALESVIQINPVSDYQQNNSSSDLAFLDNGARTSVDARPVVNGRSNIALLNMPSVIAVDRQTSANIEATLGTETSDQLFKVGHGHVVSSGGSKESVELYSHLSNDTVITSPSNNFEISCGAQMQMLVGVNRK